MCMNHVRYSIVMGVAGYEGEGNLRVRLLASKFEGTGWTAPHLKRIIYKNTALGSRNRLLQFLFVIREKNLKGEVAKM